MGGANPWGTLSDMITKRVQDNRARKQKVEDQERDNQMKIIMSGVQAHAQNGTLTDDMIQQAQAQMQKLVPKDSIPLIEGWYKVMSMMGRARKGAKGKGNPNTPAAAPAGPGQAATPNAAPNPSPAQPAAPGANKPQTGMFPNATDMGTAAGQQQVAQEKVVRQDRQTAVDAARKWYEGRGQQMPEGESRAMQLWALTGHFPPAALGRTRMHPVTVMGENGELVPALQVEEGDDTGKVIGPDGQEIVNPKVASKWKPRTGWAKDAKGKFYSFAIDPATNQPIKGTEDYNALPPSQYLDHYKEGMYYFTDDSGNVHSVPNPTHTGVSIPSGGDGSGAGSAAVPPSMRGPASKSASSTRSSTGTATGASANSGSSGQPKSKSGDRIVGTKDTGVLNSQAQKVITTTQPVLDQVDRLVSDIDRLGLQDNNDSGYLFTSMMKYKFGKASPDGSLGNDIAGLSLGSVVEAASALGGSSRSLTALKKALQHTPNPWVDSPKLMREKLQTIKERLDDIVKDANEYGRKRQPSTAGPASAVPASIKEPQKKASSASSGKGTEDDPIVIQ